VVVNREVADGKTSPVYVYGQKKELPTEQSA
jgi:ATP-dependent Clp protease ATP-binding subunit ClpX